MAEAQPRTTVAGALTAVLLGAVLLIAVAEVLLRFGMPQWREFYSGRFMQKEAVPGYGRVAVGRPGFDGWFAQNNGDFRVRIRINASGLRNGEPVAAADGRIWVIGDSITFGWGVERDEMYSSVIARLLGRETYNVASPGADLCGYQALLARMPETVRPVAAVVGLVIENDLADYRCRRAGAGPGDAEPAATSRRALGLADIKLFLTHYSAFYNVTAMALKRVDPINRLLVAIGLVEPDHTRHGGAVAAAAETAVSATAREIGHLRSMLPPGIPFAVLIVPARFDIRDRDPYFAGLREKLAAALKARAIGVIDPTERFRSAGFAATHFAHDGHWSPAGHAVAGAVAAGWLEARLGKAKARSTVPPAHSRSP